VSERERKKKQQQQQQTNNNIITDRRGCALGDWAPLLHLSIHMYWSINDETTTTTTTTLTDLYNELYS
jgi:hypothetical protein